jgi:hypothetical protein
VLAFKGTVFPVRYKSEGLYATYINAIQNVLNKTIYIYIYIYIYTQNSTEDNVKERKRVGSDMGICQYIPCTTHIKVIQYLFY